MIAINSLNHEFNRDYTLIAGGKGTSLFSKDGREIFDACSGSGVTSVGYGNPYVIEAMHSELKSGAHYLASSS